MFINEVCKSTHLTKKAIEYYLEQSLIFPLVLENGYRNFSESDVEHLAKISVLRKLGISINDIKIVLADKTGNALKNISLQKELNVQREQKKKSIIDKLSSGVSYKDIINELQTIEKSATIIEKLLESFPDYYGRFICLHFNRFLNEQIVTDKQQIAYEKIISFLDDMPSPNFSKDLQDYLIEGTKHLGTEQIISIIDSTKKSMENPDDFLENNKEFLDQYLAYKLSDEYLNSIAYKLECAMKEFNSTSGYYDIFIPALKELSSSYENYQKNLIIANEKLLAIYPDAARLSK